ncbi:unnamed protein product [Cuscuta epithymum]|uniref:Uncharacterized protein n=1 Tax=Cuscuta epithymum TaxID=186058 RepID=A0AAV0DQR0_9ASTE|nr:unnamed protein product [Cuscuta epithymum]
MNSTLDETLGDSNPHYSRVLREKIAVREAAEKAMEARKAAMVEASWCRILKAVRIDTKQAEERLMKAEKTSEEAFEAATAIGVILYDTPEASQKHYNMEISAEKAGGSAMHTVRTSFETAFEVDKQVAFAVKSALINLANCPWTNKDEFKEMLRKISQNPDTDENSQKKSSEYDSDNASEMDFKNREVSHKFSMTKIVEMMMKRLRCLEEHDLASLATIVATCGLNAALEEAGNEKLHSKPDPVFHQKSNPDPHQNVGETPLPGLDKFLVKRLTRLEREVLEAKMTNRNVESEGKRCPPSYANSSHSSQNYSDLGSSLIKPISKLEKEIEEAKKHSNSLVGSMCKPSHRKQDLIDEIPSLDKFLVKHMSKLEKEVQEAKNRNKNIDSSSACGRGEGVGKENIDQNKNIVDAEVEGSSKVSLDKVLVKPIHRLEKMKMQDESSSSIAGGVPVRSQRRNVNCDDDNGLDKILVKHVSKLEKAKMAATQEVVEKEKVTSVSRKGVVLSIEEASSLGQVLVRSDNKCSSKLEGGEIEEDEQGDGEQIISSRHSVSRREAREKEMQQAWGGLSLGNSIRPHLSRLQRDKAAWMEAEEKERRKAASEV